MRQQSVSAGVTAPSAANLNCVAWVVVTQVVCAGVWHNGLLCLTCWLSALLLPVLLLPLYSTGQGAVVWWVTQQFYSELVPHPSCTTTFSITSACSWQACCCGMHWSQSSALVPCARSVPQHSALHSHLQPGDTITDVNGCTVRSTDTLRACIFAQVHRHFQPSHQCESVLASDILADIDLPCKQSLDRIACRMRRSSSTRRQQNSRCELASRSLATA
jgi:hypothetical protein